VVALVKRTSTLPVSLKLNVSCRSAPAASSSAASAVSKLPAANVVP
jgi:hypothetical protein